MLESNTCLNGNELILGIENTTVSSFWSWAYSDILSNRNRSIFAEFLVSSALNVTQNPRIEWDAVDVSYKNKGIEVKSAAYIQSWYQNSFSVIRFDISKKKAWISETNTLRSSPERNSDYYVFCLFTEKSKEKMNVTDINKWEFYVLPTSIINEKFLSQKSISLTKIQNICSPVTYKDLKNKIDEIITY